MISPRIRARLAAHVAIGLVTVVALQGLAHANDEACQLPENDIYNQFRRLTDISDKLEHMVFLDEPDPSRHFQLACQTNADNMTKPAIGFFQRGVPESDANGVQSKEFMLALLRRIALNGIENLNISNNIQFCMQPGTRRPGCDQMRETWIEPDGGLKYKVLEARFHLALAEGPDDIFTPANQPRPTLNDDMEVSGIYKHVPWAPLTQEEREFANENWRRERTRVVGEIDRAGNPHSQEQRTNQHLRESRLNQRNAITNLRKVHWDKYRAILEEAPFIQFLSSSDPTDADIAEAAAKQAEMTRAELQRIQPWITDLENGRNVSDEMLNALDYTLLADEVLLRTPKFCGIASGLMDYRANRENVDSAKLLVRYTLASIVMTPFATVAVGVGSTGAFTAQAYTNFDSARTTSLSEVVAVGGVPGPEAISEARDGIAVEAGMGLAMSGMGGGTQRGLTRAAARARRVAGAVRDLASSPPVRRIPDSLRRPFGSQ